MKKKKIFAICDLEETYVVRLADYLNTRGMLPYQVLAFTNLESLGQYARNNEIEILLISTDAMTDAVKEMNVRRVIILSDGEEPGLDREEAVIRKYQDSDSIARQILRYAGSHEGKCINQLVKPGLALQKLVTREPDEKECEVAIAAVEAVFDWRAWQNKK